MTSPRPAHIETRNAWVEFPIFDAKSRSLKKTVLGGTIGRNSSNVVVIEALRDITMSLNLGDRVGLVGHNGAGKSTLLRLLSGIYEPTRGSATVTGRVAPVFDLGIGMDPEISGYENIIIRGLFLGQTRRQMLAKVDEIAEFTELGDYLSMPLRTYSTGMRVRLAMGVVTSIDPEILLLDEGIGAVDADFLKKAQTRLQTPGGALGNPGVRQSFQRIPRAAVQDRDVDRPRRHQTHRRHRGRRARLRG